MSNEYLLFKQVFNNVFLCKKIFKIVRHKNRQISLSNCTSKSYLQRCRYDQASFQWCLKNKQYQLLYYKVKMGVRFNEETDQYCTFQNLKTFIQQVQVDHDEIGVYTILNKFYQVHSEMLLSTPYLNKDTGFIDISLLPFSVFTQCPQFVEIVFSDNKNKSSSSSPSRFNQICEFDKENTVLNGNLLDTACRLGNLQIIKFLHETVGLQFSNEKATFNSLISDSRDAIIEYLLNDVKYIPPTSYTGNNDQFKDHYTNLLKLDFNLFKRLHQLNFPILFDKKQQDQLIENCCSLIINQKTKNNNGWSTFKLTFKTFVNILQSLLYLSDSLKNTKTIDTTTLKKIENVIYYNNNNCIKPIGQQQQENGSLLSNFKSILGIYSNTSTTTKDKTIGIVYENFNFKREITRIFIYDYLKQFKRKQSIKEETWLKLILKFASKYNEHHLIETKNIGTKFHQNVYSPSYPIFITQSLKKADCKLVEIMVSLFQDSEYRSIFTINADDENTGRDNLIRYKKARDPTYLNNHFYNKSKKHTNSTIKLEQVIQFISVIFKYPLVFSRDQKESVLSYLVESPQLTIEQSDQIANIIKPIKWSATILVENETIFKHYYFKHNNLFNWSNESTIKRIIENGNLSLISFCKQYNIGLLSINHCKTIAVAKYMYEELDVKFTDIEIDSITRLDELESGYLFYYAIDKLVQDYDPILSKTKITVGSSTSPIFNYSQIKYLESVFIQHPYLFVVDPDQVNYETYFKQLYDVNIIIGFGNLKYIVNFFKEYTSSSEQQKYNLEFKSQSTHFIKSIDKLNHNQSNDKILYILNFCKDNKLKTYF